MFDTGITRALAQTKTFDRNSDLYGKSFEHWIAMELNSYLSYRRMRESLFFWRSKHQHEVDFTIDDQIAIETKATKRVTSYDLKNLKVLEEENIFRDYFLVSHDTIEKKQGSIYCIHWEHFIKKLWAGEIVK